MKRIVLFVEGEGEAEAAPHLVSRIVTELNGWDSVIVDPSPFRVGHLSKLTRADYAEWRRKLLAALKRRDVGGILVLLDGDAETINGRPFCARDCAIELSARASEIGAGVSFSTACVFACQEFESWFIGAAAGFDSLPDNRRLTLPASMPANPELAPRDAKGWLRKTVSGGYRPTRDQLVFARALNLKLLRQQKMRSFMRFENAIQELIDACRTGVHRVSPS
ncbi:MAG: DUF4276 family protein [Planctomycetaceae bacterium]